jgi:GNAT superfamily N-acetyltransferase
LSSELIIFRAGNSTFSIEPLSNSTVKEASRLVKRILPNQGLENASIAFNASLAFDEKRFTAIIYKLLLNTYGVSELHYWVVVDEKSQHVVGTTGLYCYKKDAYDADWIGWMCVHPSVRGHGIGSKLVDLSVAKARNRNKKYLRLYTSDNSNEAAANRIYEKKGFRIFKKAPKKRYILIYRQKRL